MTPIFGTPSSSVKDVMAEMSSLLTKSDPGNRLRVKAVPPGEVNPTLTVVPDR
jgi:hypothetical protein